MSSLQNKYQEKNHLGWMNCTSERSLYLSLLAATEIYAYRLLTHNFVAWNLGRIKSEKLICIFACFDKHLGKWATYLVDLQQDA